MEAGGVAVPGFVCEDWIRTAGGIAELTKTSYVDLHKQEFIYYQTVVLLCTYG